MKMKQEKPPKLEDDPILKAVEARKLWIAGKINYETYEAFNAAAMHERHERAGGPVATLKRPSADEERARLDERLAYAHGQLAEAEAKLQEKQDRLIAHRRELSTCDDEFRRCALKGAITELQEDLLPALKDAVKSRRDQVQIVERARPKAPEPMTELQKKEAAWREADKIGGRLI